MWVLKSGHRHINPETLNEYLDGRLSGKDIEKVERRLQACGSCRDELEELRATVAAVRQLPMEQPRRSFVMDAPPPLPVPARKPFAFRAPTWAYAGAASIAVVALAALVSVDATGGLSSTADSPRATVAPVPEAAAARAPIPEPQANAATESIGPSFLTGEAARAPEGDAAADADTT